MATDHIYTERQNENNGCDNDDPSEIKALWQQSHYNPVKVQSIILSDNMYWKYWSVFIGQKNPRES